MITVKQFGLGCAIALGLMSCAPATNQARESSQTSTPATVAPSAAASPSVSPESVDAATEQALIAALGTYLGDNGVVLDAKQRFMTAYVDLNQDAANDALVLMNSPDFCGSGGCTLLVFQGQQQAFKFVSRSTLINNPIVVSDQRTNGWRDLIVDVRGGGAQPTKVALTFDGKAYPLNPSTQPALPTNSPVKGIEVLPEGTPARAAGDHANLEAVCRAELARRFKVNEAAISLEYARSDEGGAAYQWTLPDQQQGVCRVLNQGTIDYIQPAP